MGLLIQNGTVVTAEKTFAADIVVEGETIKEVRAGIAAAPVRVVPSASAIEVIVLAVPIVLQCPSERE